MSNHFNNNLVSVIGREACEKPDQESITNVNLIKLVYFQNR